MLIKCLLIKYFSRDIDHEYKELQRFVAGLSVLSYLGLDSIFVKYYNQYPGPLHLYTSINTFLGVFYDTQHF